MSPVRATRRGAERTPIAEPRADVLVCGASFAGLAAARELARLPLASRPDVLVVDRYEIGERATSACAAPTPWLEAMGVTSAIRAELPFMSFTTPHGGARYRLPWSWSSFDYRELCLALWAQCGDARFEIAKVEGRGGPVTPKADEHRRGRGESAFNAEAGVAGGDIGIRTDRGELSAPLVLDALGWRRVLSAPHYQPPEAPLSRGLEVHPHVPAATAGDALDCWVDRSLVRRGYAWRVPAGAEARIGVGSYDPHQHVKEATKELAGRLDTEPVRYQGNWFPHRLRPATEGDVFFAGDSAGHCLPLSGEGIRTAFAFGIAAAREMGAVLDGTQDRATALRAYHARSAAQRRFYARLLRLQRVMPALPPRLLALAFRALSPQPLVDRAFGWYLDQAHPDLALAPAPPAAEPTPVAA
jgi:menaquinone-9 beta-reductase